MTGLSRRVAADSLAALPLDAAHRALVEHWLSLWQGDALPPRAALNPARMKAYLPNMMLFNVVPDVSVHVRLAGTHFTHILGVDLTGVVWFVVVGSVCVVF